MRNTCTRNASNPATCMQASDVYSGSVMRFRTPHSAPSVPSDWVSLVAGGWERHEAPGRHLTIRQAVYGRTPAAKLRVCRTQVQAKQPGTGTRSKEYP